MRTVLLAVAVCVAVFGQAPEPPPKEALENTGKPLRVPFECAPKDMRSHGLTCPFDEPCPVYLELSGLELLGNKIFAAGNLHTQSATLFSILLASEDGGKTWSEPHERIPSAGLDQIQFFDFENGWVSGQRLVGVPRDPFLLLTTDGGKTWRARPIYSDTKVGVIDRFRFESKDRGTVWIDRSSAGEPGDRYEMYESMTGGENWMFRQMSDKPIPAPERRAAQGWRIRPDAATQSYRLEKRSGEGWESLAAFLIRAGECREPEMVLPEPPPPETPKSPEAAPEPPTPPSATKPKPARPPSLKRQPE